MITKEQAIKAMKERGYESVSHTESGGTVSTINFCKRFNSEITFHANVELKSECVTLSFVELKYFCELRCHRFSYDHKDFEKYEQVIAMYAAKCLDIDVFQVLALIPLKTNTPASTPKEPKKDVKTRKRELWDKIVTYGKEKEYSKDMCMKFYNYWTEMNEGGKKMRFEMQKVFNVEGRLRTWYSKDQDYAIKNRTFVDKKIEKQDKERKCIQTVNKDEIF